MCRDYSGLLFALLAATVAGCIPEPHPLEGKACDAAHACPNGLICLAQLCTSASTPDETVLVSDFELGSAGYESSNGGRAIAGTASPHGGVQALRVTPTDGAAAPFGAQTIASTLSVASARYCATGWMLHGATGTGVLSMQLRAFGGAGGNALLSESSATAPGATAKLPTTGKVYQAVHAELEINAAVVSTVRLVISSASSAPAEFFADDVKVIRTVHPCATAN